MKRTISLLSICISLLIPLCAWAAGRCGSITSCDSRYKVSFVSCVREGQNVKMSYKITNSGPDVRQIKLWQAPAFTNFTAGGNTYNKDNGLVSSTFGNATGIGDLFVPLRSGESIIVTHTIKVPSSIDKFDKVNVRIFNYGTGDWQCAKKDISFSNVQWD